MFNTTPSKNRRFKKSSTEFLRLVTGFESRGPRLVSRRRGGDYDLESPAKKRRLVRRSLCLFARVHKYFLQNQVFLLSVLFVLCSCSMKGMVREDQRQFKSQQI